MTGNDRYPYEPYDANAPYGPQHQPPVQYDQYGRPLPQNRPQPSHGSQQPPSAPASAYPVGPLSLPDETSIYIYGNAPDDYTQVTPAVPPPTPRRADPGRAYPAQPYAPAAAPARPLVWQELLSGLVTRPLSTLDRTRDHAFWWPALIVSAICGVLAMVANDSARDQILTSTLSTSVPAVLLSAVLVPAFLVVVGWVSTILARSLGGNGDAGPFITLAALVTWLADAPRLVVSLFANDDNTGLFALGLASIALTAWLLTAVAMRVHELPWPRALGAVSVQLIALLVALKLPVTG